MNCQTTLRMYNPASSVKCLNVCDPQYAEANPRRCWNLVVKQGVLISNEKSIDRYLDVGY